MSSYELNVISHFTENHLKKSWLIVTNEITIYELKTEPFTFHEKKIAISHKKATYFPFQGDKIGHLRITKASFTNLS